MLTALEFNQVPAQEAAFRSEIRQFLNEALVGMPSHAKARSWMGTSDDFSKKLAKQGWLGLTIPKEYGGSGKGFFSRFVLSEELLASGAPVASHWIADRQSGPLLLRYGTEAQRQFYIPRICRGEAFFCIGMSEPSSGSDLASIRSRAQRTEAGWLLNGSKIWTTNAHGCHYMIALVRTSGETSDRQKGLSQVIIDLSLPGVTVRPIILLDGSAEVNEVFFDNVEVPAENLIGEENKGWNYAKYLLAHERTNIADVNRAKRELERLKRIAKTEGVYEDSRFRDEIAKLEVDVVALEMMVLRVLSAEKSGKQSLDIAGLLKIRGSEIQQRYSELMMLAAGPFALPLIREAMEAGWQGDHVGHAHCAPLASTYFNMRKTTIYGGSNEVQRNIVSQFVLG